MNFNLNQRPVRWTDRTLTILRGERLEACQKELAGLDGCGLFDPETTDADAERLFEQSYYATEEKKPRLHTIEEMRTQVLSQLPAEIGLLSDEEFKLTLRLALFGGEIPLWDWNDLPAARSLVYRMWCRIKPEKGLRIVMPRQISFAALLMLASEELRTVREIMSQVTETMDNTLYLAGMMPAEIVVKDMGFQLQGSLAGNKPQLYVRTLKAMCETMVAGDGRLMLLHPGLAEPRSLPEASRGLHPGLDQNSLGELYESLMDVEDPVYDKLLGLICDLSRQEARPEDTVEDLILLAKQDAPVEEMRKVLASRIICLPTEEMIAVLREMRERIPRWFTLNMERVQ